MQNNRFFQIAIDGPVAAGKGTVAKKLAARLHFLYVDTGAMYRAAGLLAADNQLTIEEKNETAIADLLQKAEFHLENTLDETGNLITLVSLNGKDVSDKIRTAEVSGLASKVATLKKVREVLVKKQQSIAEKFNVVMEGRDIGLRVLPEAQLKLYLTADLDERARRRYEQNKNIDQHLTLEMVKKQVAERDYLDMHRENDPLTVVPDAVVIDTTKIDAEAAVEKIIKIIPDQVRDD